MGLRGSSGSAATLSASIGDVPAASSAPVSGVVTPSSCEKPPLLTTTDSGPSVHSGVGLTASP